VPQSTTIALQRLSEIFGSTSRDPSEIMKSLRPDVARRKLGYRIDWLSLTVALEPASRANLTRLGTGYGGWVIPDDVLSNDSVVYSGGIGTDASFDQALIRRYGCEVHAFDPVSEAARYAEDVAASEPRFHFHPYGLWSADTTLEFFAPSDPDHVSHSIVDLQGTQATVPAVCKRLSTVLDELGHDRVDLLKLDIEGAEYEVLQDLRAGDLRPAVMCIEFHRTSSIREMLTSVLRTEGAGYRVVNLERSNVTFVREDLLA
jgi:FkbM family methyltransferase